MKRAYAFIMLSAAGVACFASVDVVYFQTLGYSLAFIGVMTAAFNLAVTAAELPFAILFGRYSNKLALQLGNALRIVAFALFFINLSEPTLLLAQLLAAAVAPFLLWQIESNAGLAAVPRPRVPWGERRQHRRSCAASGASRAGAPHRDRRDAQHRRCRRQRSSRSWLRRSA